MKRDVKTLLTGLALLVSGGIALSIANIGRVSPDVGPTAMAKLLHGLALIGLLAVICGSMAMVLASAWFCGRLAAAKLFSAGLAFLIGAAAMSAISRAFPPKTYAWIPAMLPWLGAITSGCILLLTAIFRAVSAKRP
jgi:hypothetical protein